MSDTPLRTQAIRTSISLNDFVFDSSSRLDDFATHVVEAERLGVDTVWSAEAWGTDAVVPLAYLAALTSRIRLASGIMQISARSPVMTAMTAMTLNRVSKGRFVLGLGASGPQVVEGMHGQPYARPLERLRETVDIVRLGFSGERVEYHGRQLELPRPSGQGKAIRIAQPPQTDIPVHLATLGPEALRLTGEIADGWVGTCFVPESSRYFTDLLREGAARTGRPYSGLEVSAGGPVVFTDDIDRPIRARKKALAFQLSSMGSSTTNFYNDAYSRVGYAEAAHDVRRRWLAGDRDGAVDAVPDEMAVRTSLIGDDASVTARIRAYRDAGVTDLRLEPMGRSADERLATLARVLELVAAVNRESTV